MIIAHASFSIIANRLLNKEGYKNKKISIVSDILAGLFGILPDFDFFYLVASGDSSFNHHSLISHTPIFWFIIFLIMRYGLYLLSSQFNKETDKVFNKKIIDIFTLSLLIGTISHLVADLFTGQIMLFYPINNFAFSILGNILPTNLFAGYGLHPIFGLELVIILISIYILFTDYLETKAYKSAFIATVSVLIISISIIYSYIYSITYNKEVFPLQNNGLPDYDQDGDHLIDTADLDTNNDGKNNLQDVNYELLVNNAYDILNSHKLTSYNYLALRIGGYDSSRIILGSYAQQTKAIEPVLYNYLIINNKRLKDNQDYMQVLLDYLTKYKSISDIRMLESIIETKKGNIFFILNNSNQLVNEGMVLNNNDLAITLPNEKNLKIHTIEDIKRVYSDKEYFIISQE